MSGVRWQPALQFLKTDCAIVLPCNPCDAYFLLSADYDERPRLKRSYSISRLQTVLPINQYNVRCSPYRALRRRARVISIMCAISYRARVQQGASLDNEAD